MYFENKLEEEIFAKALALLNQLYGGAQAQEEHFENRRKNLVVLNGNKIPIESEKENLKKSTTTKGVDEMKIQGITIHKNKNCNTWYTRYRKDGIQHYISAKTQKECYEKLKKELNIIKKQKTTIYTLQSWYNKWLELFKIGKVRKTTLRDYSNITKHIPIKTFNKNINKIEILEIQEIINNVNAERQKQKLYELLKAIFQKAKDFNIIEENILLKIEKPQHKRINGKAMSIEEQQLFINYCKKNNYDIFLICLYQGLRKGEVLGLTGNDINFQNNIIKINKAYNEFKEICQTKNEYSNRTIPIFENSIEILKKYSNYKAKRLFNYSLTTLHKIFKNCLKESGIKNNYTIHDLRHTFVTNCKNLNIPEHIIQHLIGHRIGSKITGEVYTHITQEELIKNCNKINKKFYSNSTQKKED